jgi:hypothetical protein
MAVVSRQVLNRSKTLLRDGTAWESVGQTYPDDKSYQTESMAGRNAQGLNTQSVFSCHRGKS